MFGISVNGTPSVARNVRLANASDETKAKNLAASKPPLPDRTRDRDR